MNHLSDSYTCYFISSVINSQKQRKLLNIPFNASQQEVIRACLEKIQVYDQFCSGLENNRAFHPVSDEDVEKISQLLVPFDPNAHTYIEAGDDGCMFSMD